MLGIDISSTTIKLIELSRSGDRFRVEAFAVASLPQDCVVEKNINNTEVVADALRSLYARARSKNKLVCAAVAGSSVITKSLPMPLGLNDDDMETQLTLFKNTANKTSKTETLIFITPRILSEALLD